MRRRFTKTERGILFLAADGKSEASGEPLGPEAIIAEILKAQRRPMENVTDQDEPLEARLLRKSRRVETLSRKWARREKCEYQDANRRLIKRYGKVRSKWTEKE